MFSSTVLEIKDGHFRYWFDSDVRLPKEPEYPLSGEYLVNGDTITLKNDQIYERRWTFRILNGKVTLWRPSAIDYYNEKQLFDPYGILRLTDKQADEAWRTRHGTPHGQTK